MPEIITEIYDQKNRLKVKINYFNKEIQSFKINSRPKLIRSIPAILSFIRIPKLALVKI